eukprot:3740625-Rhodomonas_salina.2
MSTASLWSAGRPLIAIARAASSFTSLKSSPADPPAASASFSLTFVSYTRPRKNSGCCGTPFPLSRTCRGGARCER